MQTFSFEELQKTDVQEQAEYRKKYLQINDVEEMNSKYENILLLGSTGFWGFIFESIITEEYGKYYPYCKS
mgnify:CR=1 FL=1